MEIFDKIPEVFYNFIITLLLSLLIGFEQRKRISKNEEEEDRAIFGTDRSFAFIGMLGFILYILDEKNMVLFTAGAIIIAIYFAVYYYLKVVQFKAYGLTSILVGLITYALGPFVVTQPKWLTILIAVSVLILVERKDTFAKLSTKIDISEFLTLGKFLIIAGVVLPITPRDYMIPYINISPYDIWLTIVIVSSISYISYILHRYVFPKSGVIISGLLGGLYSSTATTLVLARQTKSLENPSNEYASSIIAATGMMYFRILILMFIFNRAIFTHLITYMVILFVASLAIAAAVYYFNKPKVNADEDYEKQYSNPLELKIALLFAFLFVFFGLITHYVIQSYGGYGLNILSYVVGFTDIDPFLLNLFQGNYSIGIELLSKAVLQAIVSNNILKAGYIIAFADKNTRRAACIGFALITSLNIVFALMM
jgi:uncharacterized membrane protein (DUF4010 family)